MVSLKVMGHGQSKGHDIGRWALVNVKLHFFSPPLFMQDWPYTLLRGRLCVTEPNATRPDS